MKRRVLQLIGSFHQGGSERQAVALTRALATDGTFEIFAATLNNEGPLLAEMAAAGLPEIPEFPLTSFYNTNFARQVRRCAGYLRTNNIDLVQTHDFYTNVFGMAAATLAGTRARVASKRETTGMRSRGQELIEKLAFGRAHHIVANAAAVRDHLTGRGVPARKITVIHNGVDPGQFELPTTVAVGARQSLGLPANSEARLITLVANLRHPVKDVPMLLRTARRVADARSDVDFVIAGEGELAGELKKMATEMNLADRVHFIGRCSDVPALLAVSYACVLTSTSEGFAGSVLEYMAAGKPVVATRVGGADEAITDGHTGYLVSAGDDAAMADRIVELLDDPDRAERYGAAGKEVLKTLFSRPAQTEKTVDLYETLLDQTPNKR